MARSLPQSYIRNPITYIFGVDSNVRVLRELVRHGGRLSSSTISRQSGLSRTSVWLALQVLQNLNVVTSEGSDNTRLFKFNMDHFLADSIGLLFRTERDRFSSLLEAIKASTQTNSQWIRSLWMYGSVVRREDVPGSDIDVAVIVDSDHLAEVVSTIRENLRQPSERLDFLPYIVGLETDDVKRLVGDDDPWWQNSIRDAFVLFGDHPDDVAKSIKA
ncbi:nucleotidyltransferase domain-containing protein [Phyllobacterium sp. LjRoot231]|uniref:nucleotidyltransferase domain-containing protein n=1 Tax=Phyllobacterium sp. LjRoot231 TaxID=3342289 RepID=UPI003ECC2D01